LKYGENETYKPNIYGESNFQWDIRHQAPGGPPAQYSVNGANVMPDLAAAMIANPKMKLLLSGGYYDLATPFFEGIYEMHHLPIPDSLQANIIYHYYESGHMIYVNDAILKQFHDDIASLIRSTAPPK
jgi:carboxypeptidase C (cathepsin A)